MFSLAKLRFEQLVSRNSNSLPHISGDGFRAISKKNRFSTFNEDYMFAEGSLVFTKSENLEGVLDSAPELNQDIVIFAGNSDREFFSVSQPIPSCVKRIYLQNSFISDQKFIRTLPIGVENRSHSMNGKPRLLKSSIPFGEKKNAVLIGPFGNTDASRESLLGLKSSKYFSVQSQRLEPRSFAALAGSFKFIACPRGNGVDTHRVWETLYRGSVPIVIDDEWSRSLDYLSLPIIKVPEWSEEALANSVKRFSDSSIKNPIDLKFLWIDAWLDLISKDLTDSS